jgi:hypothetical protein
MEDDNVLDRAMQSTFAQLLAFVFSVLIPAATLAASATARRWVNVHGFIVAGVAIVAVALLVLYIDHLSRSRARGTAELKQAAAELARTGATFEHISNELDEARRTPSRRDIVLYERFTRELAPDSEVIHYLKVLSGQRWNRNVLLSLANFRLDWLEERAFFDDVEVDAKRTKLLLAIEEFFRHLNAEEGEEIRAGSGEYRVKSPSISENGMTYEQVTHSLEQQADHVLEAHSELLRTGRARRL